MPEPTRRRHLLTLLARAPFALILLLLILFGFGISNDDAARMRQFSAAVDRWQVNPDFPAVADEYVRLSCPAMRARLAGVSATRFLMSLRSLPGLPERLAVAPTSQAHYDNFSRGPLSAYLHLTSEQGLAGILPTIEQMDSSISDDDARAFLASFNIDPPVVTDAGAVASVRSLLQRIGPARPLVARDQLPLLFQHHIAELAKELQLPVDPALQTVEQQALMHDRLDAHIRTADPELWRTKQVSDFLSGIWAQCYGQTYGQLLRPLLLIRSIARISAVILLCAVILFVLRRRRVGCC